MEDEITAGVKKAINIHEHEDFFQSGLGDVRVS